MNAVSEVTNDLLNVKEQEAFYKSKGESVPVPASSVSEAKEHLKQAEAELYRSE